MSLQTGLPAWHRAHAGMPWAKPGTHCKLPPPPTSGWVPAEVALVQGQEQEVLDVYMVNLTHDGDEQIAGAQRECERADACGDRERRVQAELGGQPAAAAILGHRRARPRLPALRRQRHPLLLRGTCFEVSRFVHPVEGVTLEVHATPPSSAAEYLLWVSCCVHRPDSRSIHSDDHATLFYCEISVCSYHGLCIDSRALPSRSMQRHPLLPRGICFKIQGLYINSMASCFRSIHTPMANLPSSAALYGV